MSGLTIITIISEQYTKIIVCSAVTIIPSSIVSIICSCIILLFTNILGLKGVIIAILLSNLCIQLWRRVAAIRLGFSSHIDSFFWIGIFAYLLFFYAPQIPRLLYCQLSIFFHKLLMLLNIFHVIQYVLF